MVCRTVKVGTAVAIVCSRGERRKRCTCGQPATKLCDYPVERRGKRATCDRTMCEAHATKVGPDLDHCAEHAGVAPPPDLLFGHGGQG